jgi:hypothetical protein
MTQKKEYSGTMKGQAPEGEILPLLCSTQLDVTGLCMT